MDSHTLWLFTSTGLCYCSAQTLRSDKEDVGRRGGSHLYSSTGGTVQRQSPLRSKQDSVFKNNEQII